MSESGSSRPVRKKYFGIVVNGPARGKILESSHAIHEIVQLPVVATLHADDITASPLHASVVPYRWESFSIGDRIYGTWHTDDLPSVSDVILTLIDTEPEVANACLIRSRQT